MNDISGIEALGLLAAGIALAWVIAKLINGRGKPTQTWEGTKKKERER